MTEKKRFTIKSSAIVQEGYFIKDEKNTYTFPTTTSYGSHLHMYCKALNELAEENEQLKTIIQQLRTDNTKQKKKLNTTMKENEQLKSFINDLTTKGTGRIDLANGYSYRVNAVLTNWKGDMND